MLILSGIDDESVEAIGEYGSWLTDRLGQTGAGVAMGAAVLGAGFAANRYMNLGLGTKFSNLTNRITGSTTAGRIATAMAPAAAQVAVAAATGGGGGQAVAEQAQTQQAVSEQAAIEQAMAQQAATQATAKPAPQTGVSPWIPLGIIATAAAGWFAFKD